jgi:hypothetical protein
VSTVVHNGVKQFVKLPIKNYYACTILQHTLESGIDVGQGINVGPGKFAKKNKHMALNKRRAS